MSHSFSEIAQRSMKLAMTRYFLYDNSIYWENTGGNYKNISTGSKLLYGNSTVGHSRKSVYQCQGVGLLRHKQVSVFLTPELSVSSVNSLLHYTIAEKAGRHLSSPRLFLLCSQPKPVGTEPGSVVERAHCANMFAGMTLRVLGY